MPEEKEGLIMNAAKSLGSAAAKIASLAGLAPAGDAISLLKEDHDKVKDIFDRFEKTDVRKEKKALVDEALLELKVHATLEEELFYPTVRERAGDLINEADEEHHVVKVLIAELEQMPSSDDHYDAKFTVLTENVRHHIREEENEIFPQARGMEMDWDALGETMRRRKEELMAAPPAVTSAKTKPKRRKVVRQARRKKSAA